MKYFYCFFISLGCIYSSNAQSIEITCDKPQLVKNDHVGNEWFHSFEVNGTYYPIDQPVRLDLNTASKLKFEIREQNEKYPDHSIQSIGIDPGSMELNKTYSKQLELTIKESNGRYAGNTATWRVSINYRKIHNKV